jgi:hypothetical protein
MSWVRNWCQFLHITSSCGAILFFLVSTAVTCTAERCSHTSLFIIQLYSFSCDCLCAFVYLMCTTVSTKSSEFLLHLWKLCVRFQGASNRLVCEETIFFLLPIESWKSRQIFRTSHCMQHLCRGTALLVWRKTEGNAVCNTHAMVLAEE